MNKYQRFISKRAKVIQKSVQENSFFSKFRFCKMYGRLIYSGRNQQEFLNKYYKKVSKKYSK